MNSPMNPDERALTGLEQEAEAFLQQKQFPAAYSRFLVLAKTRPHHEPYRIRLGEICLALGRKEDALRLFKHLAANLLDQGKIVQAMTLNKRILEIDPHERDIQNRLSELCADVLEVPSPKMREEAKAAVQQMARAPLELQACASGGDAQYDDVFDVSSNLGLAKGNTNVELTIGGHDNYKVIDYAFENQNAAHLTLMGGAPMKMETPNIPLFSDLPPKAFQQLLEKFKRWSAPAESVLVRQGDAGDSIFIIAYGAVKVLRKVGDEVKTLGELKAGDFFGEFAYFSKRPREASLVATMPVEVLELTRACVDEVIVAYPKVEKAMQNLYKKRVLENLLAESELFAPLSAEERAAFVQRFQHRQVSAGQTIIRQGDVADAFYVIQCGSVRVTREGLTEPLAVLKEGQFFGEFAMITGQKRNASVTALEKTDLVTLSKEVFVELLRLKPQVWERVRAIAQKRVAEIQARQR